MIRKRSIVTVGGMRESYVDIHRIFEQGMPSKHLPSSDGGALNITPGTYYILDPQEGYATINLQPGSGTNIPVYHIVVTEDTFGPNGGIILPDGVVWAGGEEPNLTGKNAVITIVGNIATCAISTGDSGAPKFLPSGSDPADAVFAEFGGNAQVGTVYPGNTVPDRSSGVTSFVSESGKLVTWEYDSVNNKYTVTSVEDIDPNTYYSLAASGVDAYYHYSNVGGTYGIAIGMCMRKKYTPEYIAITGVGYAFRIPINPSLYADLSETSPVQALQFSASGISVPSKVAGALALEPVMGRFLASSNTVNIILPNNIRASDKNPDIEENHVYEYSILDGIFSYYDVTPVADQEENPK